MEVQQQGPHLHIGENLDVLDKVNKWCNGEVLSIQNGQAYIHYTGWHPKFDQIIPINSSRILKQWVPGKPIKVFNRIDVYHPLKGWLEARAVQLGKPDENNLTQKVKIHFLNYHSRYDTWVDLNDKNQVTLIGERSKAFGIGKRRRGEKDTKKLLSELAREILKQNILKMIRQFKQSGLIMKQVGGDGNCLFRSVSDQLYGQETFHNQIRQLCMKYILQEKSFFQNFIVEDIQHYVERKSQSGVWGDDIEIEALSQIYNRPIQIYAMGIKPIRTFHEDSQYNVEPLRLAYIGSCHYNSIKKQNNQNIGLIDSRFGDFQTLFFNAFLQQKNSEKYWKSKNRQQFSHLNPLELTIEERLESQTGLINEQEEVQKDLMQQAMQASQNEQISKQIQAAELKELQKKLQQQAIQKQLRRLEQQQLQEAKKVSKNQNNSNNVRQKPYWFEDLESMGFNSDQIWFAIQIKGYDPEGVQNFLLDNM